MAAGWVFRFSPIPHGRVSWRRMARNARSCCPRSSTGTGAEASIPARPRPARPRAVVAIWAARDLGQS